MSQAGFAISRAEPTSTVQIHEAAIQRIIHSSDEPSRIRAQKQSQRRHFLGFSHSANGLSLGQLVIHFLLPPGIILAQSSIHEWRVHSRRGNAVAANVVSDVVARD